MWKLQLLQCGFITTDYLLALEHVQSFFTLLWNKDRFGVGILGYDTKSKLYPLHTKLKFMMHTGKRQEGAWINMDNTECVTVAY